MGRTARAGEGGGVMTLLCGAKEALMGKQITAAAIRSRGDPTWPFLEDIFGGSKFEVPDSSVRLFCQTLHNFENHFVLRWFSKKQPCSLHMSS